MTLKIQKVLDRLSPAERKIAGFVMANPRQVTGMSAAQLAANCGTAPSAVIRFCKSVGAGGFSQLKLALAEESGYSRQDAQLPAIAEEKENVVRRVFVAGIETLKGTLEQLEYDKVEAMADALAGAKRIFVFGIGTSSVIASDAQYRLSQLGLWATACTDILMMNVTASNLGPGDVALGISHSGRTKPVVDAMRRAKEGGAVTLAITSFRDSLLFRECDLGACVYADEVNYPVEAVSARVAHTCLIDGITMLLATRNLENFAQHIKTRNRILDELRY